MKKTTVIVIVFGLIFFYFLYWFRGNTSLKEIQDWLNNNGLATILAIFIPIWIYFIVYLWNKRKEETPEYKKHEELLINIIRQLEDIKVVDYRELSLISWWNIKWRERRGNELLFGCWKAKLINDSVVATSCLESNELWDYLKMHLKKSKLQALLNEWKLTMEKDLLARKLLYDSITKKVVESTEIQIVQYEYGKEHPKPYITDYFVAVIYDAIFCNLTGNPLPVNDTKSYLRYEVPDEVVWYWGANSWLLLSIEDTKQREEAINLLLKLESELIKLPEVQKAKDLYFEAIDKTKQLVTMVKITTNLPRGKRCDYCKKL